MALTSLHVALIWILASVVIWQNYQQSVAGWKLSTEKLSLAVAAQAAQAKRAADLVLKSVVDWVDEENVGDEERFRQFTGSRAFFEAMRARVVAIPQVGMTVVADAKGEILNSLSGWPTTGRNIADREAFRAAFKGEATISVLAAPGRGVTDGTWRFYLTRRLAARDGSILGIAGVGLNVEYFATLFRNLSLGPDSWITLFRSDGTLLATSLPGSDLLGQRFADALPESLIGTGRLGRAVVGRQTLSYAPGGAAERILVAAEVEGFPAYVVVALGESVFLEPWRSRNILIVAVASALTLLALAGGLRMLRLSDRAETAMRADSERQALLAIVDSPTALTAIVDHSGRVVQCNARFRALLQAGSDEAGGDEAGMLLDPSLKGMAPLLAFVRSGAGQAMSQLDLEVERRDGEVRRLHVSLSRQRLPGTGDCVVIVGHDETQRHQAQQAIAMSSRLVTLGELTSSIAHEVSQPLNVIRMAAQNALADLEADAEPDGVVGSKFRRIIAQVDRAAAIISRMRIFNRTPGEKAQLFDVRSACRNALDLVAPQMRRDRIETKLVLPDEPLSVTGSSLLIEQAIVYLLRNAREALLSAHAAAPTIEVAASRGATGRVLIRVADNGPGVPPELRERIFEPFFTTKPNHKHTGLGLTLAFGAVRDSAGRLTLLGDAAVPSEGTIFQIELAGGEAEPAT